MKILHVLLVIALVLCASCASRHLIRFSDGSLVEFSRGHLYSVHVRGDGIGSVSVSIDEILNGQVIPVSQKVFTIYDACSNPRGQVDGRLHIVMNTDVLTAEITNPNFEIIHNDVNYMQEHMTSHPSPRIRRFEGGGYMGEDGFVPLEGRTVVAGWLCNTNDWEDGWSSHDAALDLLNIWKPIRLNDTWASNNLARLVAFSETNDVVFARIVVETTRLPNQAPEDTARKLADPQR